MSDDSVPVDFDPADYPDQFELVRVTANGTPVYRPREIDGCGGCENGECCGACECCPSEDPHDDDLRAEWWERDHTFDVPGWRK